MCPSGDFFVPNFSFHPINLQAIAVPLSLEICLVTSIGSEALVPDKSFRFC